MPKKLIAILLVLTLGLALLSCVKGDENSGETQGTDEVLLDTASEQLEPTEGGTLKLCMYGVDTLNPLVTKSEANSEILSLMYDGLFKLGTDLYPEYALCESASTASDGLTVTLKVRDDVSFHNGEKLTGADVSFSVMLAKESGGVFSEKLKNVSGATASGQTVTITLDAPVFNFISNLTFPVLRAEGNASDAINSAAGYSPNGTGIYKLSEYKLNKSLSLTATNSHYDAKNPYIKDVKIELVKNRETAIDMLENSLCDVLSPSVATKGDYSGSSNLNEVPLSGGSFTFLGVNNQHAVLLDAEIRKALSKAINRDAFMEIAGEEIHKAVIPVYPESWLYYEMQPGGSFVPTEAAQAISDLGWSDTDSDGILDKIVVGEKANLYLDILVNEENQTRLKLAEAIKKDFEQTNIAVTVTSLPFSEYQSRIAAGLYDLFIGEIQFGDNQDISGFVSGYENAFGAYKEELFRAFENVKTAGTSEEIKAQYGGICGELINSMPTIGLYFKDDVILVNNRIKGKITPNRSDIFANVSDWFIY